MLKILPTEGIRQSVGCNGCAAATPKLTRLKKRKGLAKMNLDEDCFSWSYYPTSFHNFLSFSETVYG